ncbi:MAG: M61 family metallopeptidase [Rhodoferax sp.]|nr:M61 family metallopeptidase [Rhodoferax sp.]
MKRSPVDRAAVVCRVELADLHAHLFRVTMTLEHPQPTQRLVLPVWIPGSYLVREFSKNLQQLTARQGRRACEVRQQGKNCWDVDCDPGKPLELQYEIHAHDDSVRTAWLDATRGFFNGTSVFLQAQGLADAPHRLELLGGTQRSAWEVATGLAPVKVDRRGWGSYLAQNYDELVDCPVEMGAFWSGRFVVAGVRHRLVVAGAAPSFDGPRLLEDTRRICEAAVGMWHGGAAAGPAGGPVHQDYVFMLNAVDDGYGGLEHRNSTALIAARKDLPRIADKAAPARQPEGYTTLLGLISHEYFHTWNIKRLRPAEFAQFDYGQENYTRLLWFFEGFTSYYDDLLLRRSQLVDDASYLRLLTKTINQVLQTPGRKLQSVAQSSYDAWVKYYRQDANTPNATVSYYTKGACVALCLDLSLRAHGGVTLDDVMRGLWRRCQGGPMTEQDLLDELQARTGRSWQRDIAAWVHGTRDLPLRDLLERQGVAVLEEPAQPAQALGLRVAEQAGVQVRVVLRGGAAERAGFAAGDEWLAVEVGRGRAAQCWRLQRLDDLALFAGTARSVVALVARDRRVLRLDLRLPQRQTTWRLAVRDASQVGHWLDAAAT